MLYMWTLSMQVISISNAFNAMYVNSQYKTHPHISAHNFLNIQTQGFSTIPLNVMYVNTVNVSHKYF